MREVPTSRLFDIADCVKDPHFRARAAVQQVEDPLIGPHPASGPGDPSWTAIRRTEVVAWTGPAIGAHTAFVLEKLLAG